MELIMNGPTPFFHPVSGKYVAAYEWYEGYAHQEHEQVEEAEDADSVEEKSVGRRKKVEPTPKDGE